jgi:hypothetical protein
MSRAASVLLLPEANRSAHIVGRGLIRNLRSVSAQDAENSAARARRIARFLPSESLELLDTSRLRTGSIARNTPNHRRRMRRWPTFDLDPSNQQQSSRGRRFRFTLNHEGSPLGRVCARGE